MKAFEDKHGVQIRQLWGMTETSPVATVAWPPPGASDEEHWALRATQGRPMCGVEVRIVDDAGDAAAQRRQGRRRARGPRALDHRLVLPQPRRPSKFDGGWLRTGDVGPHRPAGYVTLTDRAKDVIKSGGEWISSVELENHLIAHPAVLEAAVVGVPDERWQERPLAAVVLKDGADATPGGVARVPGRQGRSLVAARAVDVRRRRCRGPASASTTRRPSGPGTPTATTRWSTLATDVAHRLRARLRRPRGCSAKRASPAQRSARW